MGNKAKFTVKQQRFIDFYAGNGADAARKAGYKGNNKTLEAQGRQNLANPRINKLIKARETKRNNPGIKNREERQQFWSNMMDSAEKPSDALKASELLGRSEADFTDKVDNTHKLDAGVMSIAVKVFQLQLKKD